MPERSDKRGERSGRLGRAAHAERALRIRGDRRDRPLARTTTRRRAFPPWSSREGRGSRGVGVHRSFREGPDWPALPRPSVDASLSLPVVSMPDSSTSRSCPAGSASLPPERRACLVLSSVAVLLEPRLGPGQKASRERSDSMPSTTGMQAYCVRYSVHVAPCGTLYAHSYTSGAASPRSRSRGERHDR